MWLAREEGSGREVALKIVPREGNAGSRAEREAATAAKLEHERCLRARALARDRANVYIVYDYVPGCTLREAMRAGALTDDAALEAGAQILEALAHAHQHGVVHRDVKPANVLLAESPDVQVKLFDFGLALMREEDTLTAVGDIPGTLAYMSPERLRGHPAEPAADVWAVGVLLWEALAGRHPFWGGSLLDTARRIEAGAPPLRAERPDLPRAVAECVNRALAPEPSRRPAAAALAARLRKAKAETVERRRRPPRTAPSLGQVAGRLLPAAAALLYAAWSAAALAFFPSEWPLALGAAAGALALFNQRLALAFALAVPVLPLGNYALSLALVYAGAAAIWLALSWREPRTGLFLTAGPVLAPVGGLGLLPLVAQAIRNPLRRALQVAAAVLAAAAVAAAGRLDTLGIAATDHPAAAVAALAGALGSNREATALAVALAAVAVVLPFVRGRGPWAAVGLGAFMTLATLVSSQGLPAPPLVAAAWTITLALVAEPHVRRRRRRPDAEAPTAETVAVVRRLEPAGDLAGRG